MPLETIKDYNVSQKILHLGAFLKVFVSTVENYRTKFYTPVVRSIVRPTRLLLLLLLHPFNGLSASTTWKAGTRKLRKVKPVWI